MTKSSNRREGFYATYAEQYDRLQPLRIEMYQFYHELTLDFLPFAEDEPFRLLDLGCGTGTLLQAILTRFTNAQGVGVDYSAEMLDVAKQKLQARVSQVKLVQWDLNRGVPDGLGEFQMIIAFSSLHHLTHDIKRRVFRQIHEMLSSGGWFFFMDAMTVRFDDAVFRQARARQQRRLVERFIAAGIDPQEAQRVAARNFELDEKSPEKDRIAPLDVQRVWLQETGFRSIDYVWHFFMEHFFIVRK